MSLNNKVNDKTYIPLPPFKGWVLENFPFIESDFDCITNYQLLCKITEYLNNVINNQNQVQDLGTELVTAYNQLLDYINNYFDNLDVQEEINNKLDNMAEDGTLIRLMAEYLPYVSVDMYGAVGDGETDDTDAIQLALNSNNKVIHFSNKTYLVKVDKLNAPNTDLTDISKCGLSISSEKVLIGDNTILKAIHNTSESMNLYFISTSEKIEVENITFNGQYDTLRYVYGIQCNKSNNIIRNCNFHNLGSSGIVFNGTSSNNIDNNIVTNCEFKNCGNSIFGAWINNTIFENLKFYNVSEGIDLDKLSTNITMNNFIANGYRGQGADALIELNGVDHATINNIVCDNFIDGILINGKNINDVLMESKDITITNCVFNNLNGYGVIMGNALGTEYDESINIMIDNVIVRSSLLDGFHLRGKNIKVTNSCAINCRYHAILIDNKAYNVEINNFNSIGNTQGLISCNIGDYIKLINIFDDESSNTSYTQTLSNIQNLEIRNLNVINVTSFSVSSNRLFNITATKAYFENINIPVVSNAIFFITSTTDYSIKDSICTLNTIEIDKPTIVISDQTPTEIGTSMLFKTGTILIVKNGETNPNLFICVKGNFGGGSVKWRSLTGDLVE